jgi:hypothetical protein
VLTVASPADEWLHLEAVCGETIGQYVHSRNRASLVDGEDAIAVEQEDAGIALPAGGLVDADGGDRIDGVAGTI